MSKKIYDKIHSIKPCIEAVGSRYHPLAVDETGVAWPPESLTGVISKQSLQNERTLYIDI